LAKLPDLLELGKRLGVARFHVSNLLPHTADTSDDILYEQTLRDIAYLPSPWLRWLKLPKMDFNEYTREPLLKAFSSGYERTSYKHVIGNVRERDLPDLWLDPEYVAYRERIHQFAFAPCSKCGGCELSRDNITDCFDSPAPACGGCLWAQGVIQCP
jgi:MoaA/NifB/PqqE/SkfB family radical SAM enzyme